MVVQILLALIIENSTGGSKMKVSELNTEPAKLIFVRGAL